MAGPGLLLPNLRRLLSIGECMTALSQAGDGLWRKGFAGDAFNAAWYERACLPPTWTVSYFTALGDDGLSNEMATFMEEAGIDIEDVRRIEGRTPGLYMISLDKGERSFSYWRDSSAARRLAEDRGTLRDAIANSEAIYYSGITLAILEPPGAELLIEEVHRANAVGKLVVFDPNIRPRLWQDREAMISTITAGAEASSLIMPSFDDEALHYGDASVQHTIERYKGLGVAHVIVKDGVNGVTFDFEGKKTSFPQ